MSHLQGTEGSLLTVEGGIDRLTRNIGNYQSRLHNTPEE
jgi:hypothetical protein